MARALGIGALLLVLACDVTDPPEITPGANPLAGEYDVVTDLDRFSFEVSNFNDPTCSLHCTYVVPFDQARLSGRLTLVPVGATGDSLKATGSFSGMICDSVNFAGKTGCTRVTPHDRSYVSYGVSSYFSPDTTVYIAMALNPDAVTGVVIWLNGRFAGDSISGDVRWSLYVYRSPPTHLGHFVARRRK